MLCPVLSPMLFLCCVRYYLLCSSYAVSGTISYALPMMCLVLSPMLFLCGVRYYDTSLSLWRSSYGLPTPSLLSYGAYILRICTFPDPPTNTLPVQYGVSHTELAVPQWR
eukprot:3120650-Rhodomonas_salina.3